MSELTHWGVATFARQIRRSPESVYYFKSASSTEGAIALAIGFQSLLQSLELLDSYLQLQKGQEIGNLKQLYIAALPNMAQ